MHAKPAVRNPWLWVPTLYLAEGAPYVMAMTVSVILYKRLGISNTDIALYTSWLYLPWVIKPLWSPFVDMFRTKRFWIVAMQLVLGASFACVALTIPAPAFFRYTLAFFWIMAFSSATHDIAADGFYMLGLKEYQQAAFVGVRTIFYRIAMIAAKGILVVLAGTLETRGFSVASAWSVTFFFWPRSCWPCFSTTSSPSPVPLRTGRFPRPLPKRLRGIPPGVCHLLSAEGHRRDSCLLPPLPIRRSAARQDGRPVSARPADGGGLGLSTAEVGIVYGTVGAIALMLGGAARRLGHLPERSQILALDHGLRNAPAGCDLYLALPDDAGEPLCDQRRRGGGAVRLRLRLHRLFALHDHGLRGRVQDGPLRDRDGDHGPRDDDPGDVERLDSGRSWAIPASSSGFSSRRSPASSSRR